MSIFDDVPMPEDFTKLPAGGIFTLKAPIRVDAQDLQRFVEAGGTIDQAGYRLFIDDPTKIIAGNVARMAQAHPDGNGGRGSGVLIKDASSVTLKAGHVVYRVVEVDPPPNVDDEPHTWKAMAVTIAKASPKQVKLSRPFPGLARTLFEPSAFGRSFFETPLQAIQHFLTERRLEIESLDRKRKDAERAVEWAASQEGMS